MKAILFSASLFVLTAMGISLGYFFKNAPRYQAESAQQMKEAFLKNGQIEVTFFDQPSWTFAAEPEKWEFAVKGDVLEVLPPMPTVLPELQAGQNIQDLPAWKEAQNGLILALRDRLKITTSSTAQINVLPPKMGVPAQ